MLHNLDPACFDDPEKVDFDRGLSPVRHTTMGVGPHRCVGAGLARLEAIVVLEEWLARVPHFSLAEDVQPTFRGGNVGSLLQLELRWAE